MVKTFFKGFLRELLLLWKDKRMLFMFLIAPLALNIVVCGAFSNGVVNHIPLAAVETISINLLHCTDPRASAGV